MLYRIVSVALVLIVIATAAVAQEKHRKPNPLAPSLPLLTKEERGKIDKIIDQFILYDSGKLPGADGKKILADFNSLGMEAIPRLLFGFNRAARLQASCPAVIIARKLRRLFNRTKDGELLDFARDMIGTAGTAKRHMGVVRDLRLACILRKSYLQRSGQLASIATKKQPRFMDTEGLLREAKDARGTRLKNILVALAGRKGERVIDILGIAMANKNRDLSQLGQKLLVGHLSSQNSVVVKKSLSSKRKEVRAVSAYVVGIRKLKYVPELIALLDDKESMVHQSARGALVRLSNGKDFGPLPGSNDSQRTEALRNWEAWWRSASGK